MQFYMVNVRPITINNFPAPEACKLYRYKYTIFHIKESSPFAIDVQSTILSFPTVQFNERWLFSAVRGEPAWDCNLMVDTHLIRYAYIGVYRAWKKKWYKGYQGLLYEVPTEKEREMEWERRDIVSMWHVYRWERTRQMQSQWTAVSNPKSSKPQ